MPSVKNAPPTLEELTTEQKEDTSAEYLKAVEDGLEKALRSADRGETVPAEEVWSELGLDED